MVKSEKLSPSEIPSDVNLHVVSDAVAEFIESSTPVAKKASAQPVQRPRGMSSDGYVDARMLQPIHETRKYSNWILDILEVEDDNGKSLFQFSLKPLHGEHGLLSIGVSGHAPTLDAAKAILNHVLTDFSIKIEVGGGK